MPTETHPDRHDLTRPDSPRLGWPTLTLRFALELAALAGWGWSAYQLGGWAAAVVAPVLAATAWGTFAVLGDPNRSGRAPVPVSGRVRLLVETTVLVPPAIGMALLGAPVAAVVMAVGLVVDTVLVRSRTRWLWHVPAAR